MTINNVAAGGVTVSGQTFTPSADATYLLSLTVTAVGGDIQFVDAFGNVSYVRGGQAKSWSAEFPYPLMPVPTFAIPDGVEADFHWTEPATL